MQLVDSYYFALKLLVFSLCIVSVTARTINAFTLSPVVLVCALLTLLSSAMGSSLYKNILEFIIKRKYIDVNRKIYKLALSS